MTPRRGDVMDLRAEIASVRSVNQGDTHNPCAARALALCDALDSARHCIERLAGELEELRHRLDKLEVRR